MRGNQETLLFCQIKQISELRLGIKAGPGLVNVPAAARPESKLRRDVRVKHARVWTSLAARPCSAQPGSLNVQLNGCQNYEYQSIPGYKQPVIIDILN